MGSILKLRLVGPPRLEIYGKWDFDSRGIQQADAMNIEERWNSNSMNLRKFPNSSLSLQ